jgi:hypothetical protein
VWDFLGKKKSLFLIQAFIDVTDAGEVESWNATA